MEASLQDGHQSSAQEAPAQQTMINAESVRIVTLTREDLQTDRIRAVARLHKCEFSDGKPCCCCMYEDEKAAHRNFVEGLAESDSKISAFGLALDTNGEVL